jgi:DNA-binding PucR family transcriptional regulator
VLPAALGPVAGARVGVATANEGIAGFRTAYHLAVRTARTLDRGEVTVATVVDRLPEVLLEGSPEVTSILVREALGPLHALPEHQTEVLIDTLRALLAHDGSPTRAAEELYCHRNTVIYRMRQIEEVTRRRISNPRDRLLFDLALLASRHPYASGKA